MSKNIFNVSVMSGVSNRELRNGPRQDILHGHRYRIESGWERFVYEKLVVGWTIINQRQG